jgi:hypothetical protein
VENYFSPLLNVHTIADGRPKEIHTAEPIVPEPSLFYFEVDIAKFKKY